MRRLKEPEDIVVVDKDLALLPYLFLFPTTFSNENLMHVLT